MLNTIIVTVQSTVCLQKHLVGFKWPFYTSSYNEQMCISRPFYLAIFNTQILFNTSIIISPY